jgi:hypothetical protein
MDSSSTLISEAKSKGKRIKREREERTFETRVSVNPLVPYRRSPTSPASYRATPHQAKKNEKERKANVATDLHLSPHKLPTPQKGGKPGSSPAFRKKSKRGSENIKRKQALVRYQRPIRPLRRLDLRSNYSPLEPNRHKKTSLGFGRYGHCLEGCGFVLVWKGRFTQEARCDLGFGRG